MTRRWWIISLTILAAVIAGGWLALHRTRLTTSAPITVKEIRYLGTLQDPDAPKLLRDGGASARVGGQILWTFGDTLWPFKSADGTSGRSNTAALADPASPLTVTEPLDRTGAPRQFLPFTAEEQAYNDASGKPDERYALWPAHLVPLTGDRALVVYMRLKVHPGTLNYEMLSTGMAEVRSGATTARRIAEVFIAPEPQFHHSAVVKDGMLYLYGCERDERDFTAHCRIARAPLDQVTTRSAYTFWDGKGWTPDIARAVRSVPGSTSGFSVAWNPDLQRFTAVYNNGYGKAVLLRTAPRLEGPWSDEITLLTAEGPIYATYQHPDLAAPGRRTLSVSYYFSQGQFKGEIRVFAITLA